MTSSSFVLIFVTLTLDNFTTLSTSIITVCPGTYPELGTFIRTFIEATKRKIFRCFVYFNLKRKQNLIFRFYIFFFLLVRNEKRIVNTLYAKLYSNRTVCQQ